MEITLREPKVSDATNLAKLGERTFIETFAQLYKPHDLKCFLEQVHSEQAVAEELADDNLTFCVAEASGSMVGYCKIGALSVPVENPLHGAQELRQLYVLAAHQNQKIGTKLAAWAVDQFKQRKCPEVYVSVWSENIGAQRFYQRLGFEPFGEYSFMVGEQADREFIMRWTIPTRK